MIWKLFICAGISSWGCGVSSTVPMPSEEACYKALAAVRFDQTTPGENRLSSYAYCGPFPGEKIEGAK